MAKAEKTPVHACDVLMIPLLELERAPENVRGDAPNGDIDVLAEDIAGHGLLQSLIGYRTDGSLTFIVGGGRRLAALQLLKKKKRIDGQFLVPVQVRDQQEAIELSLAENLQRRDMNPADEMLAFKALQDMHPGEGVPALAKRFGFSEQHVRRRMKLAELCPEVFEALRAGAIGVDQAMAYATTSDHALQLKVFKAQTKSTWKPHDVAEVKKAISGASYAGDSPLAKFVTLAAYEAAGGGYEDDLFLEPDAKRLTDPTLLKQLATEKVEAGLAKLIKKNKLAGCLVAPDIVKDGWQLKRPKAPKETSYINAEYGGYSGETKWEKAREIKALITGIAYVNRDGKVALYEDGFFVPSAMADEIEPKQQQARAAPYVPPTPEEIEERQRTAFTRQHAWRAAVSALIEGGNIKGRLFFEQHTYLGDDGTDELGVCITGKLTAFVTEAELDAQIPIANEAYDEKKRAEAEARAEREQQAEARAAAFAETRARLIEQAPAVIVLDGQPFYRWAEGENAGMYADYPEAEDCADESFDNIEGLLDYAESEGLEVEGFASIEEASAKVEGEPADQEPEPADA